METAAEKSASAEKSSASVFRRNLTSVYTGATLIGDDIKLDEVDKDAPSGAPQAIVAVVNVPSLSSTSSASGLGKVCLVCVQPMSGKVVFDECPGHMLDQRLSLLQPIEILIPSKADGDRLLSNFQREVVLKHVEERNNLSKTSVRLEELPAEKFCHKALEKSLFGENGGVQLRQLWPSFSSAVTRSVIFPIVHVFLAFL